MRVSAGAFVCATNCSSGTSSPATRISSTQGPRSPHGQALFALLYTGDKGYSHPVSQRRIRLLVSGRRPVGLDHGNAVRQRRVVAVQPRQVHPFRLLSVLVEIALLRKAYPDKTVLRPRQIESGFGECLIEIHVGLFQRLAYFGSVGGAGLMEQRAVLGRGRLEGCAQ